MDIIKKFLLLLVAFLLLGDLGMPPLPVDASIAPSPEISGTPRGTLDVSSMPSGALISYYVGERKTAVGKAPAVFQVPEGGVYLELVLEGYQAYKKGVYITAGRTVSMVVMLEPIPSISPTSSPKPTAMDYACSQKTLEERVRCKYSLTEAKRQGLVPEECRELGGTLESDCIRSITALEACNKEKRDEDREACAREVLQLKDARQMKTSCERKKVASQRLECLSNLREGYHSLIKYRLRSLVDKAERLSKLGVGEERAIELVISLEEKRKEFDEATNLEQRKQAIWEAQRIWGDFKADAVRQLKALNEGKK